LGETSRLGFVPNPFAKQRNSQGVLGFLGMPFLLRKAKGCFELSEINLQEAYFLEWISVILNERLRGRFAQDLPIGFLMWFL